MSAPAHPASNNQTPTHGIDPQPPYPLMTGRDGQRPGETLSQLSQRVRRQAGETLGTLAHVLQRMADGVLVADRDGAVEYANPAFETIIGRHRDELIGQVPAWLAPTAERAAMWAALRAGEPYLDTLVTRNAADEPCHLQTTITPMLDAAERLAHVVVVCKDISDQVRAEEQRRQLEQSLMQAERMAAVGTVAAGIVHNLRGHLQSIVGYGELLRIGNPQLTDLDRVLDAAQQMNAMIEDILGKSRQHKAPTAVDLNELLRRELDFLQANPAFKHDIAKDVRLADGLPAVRAVYSDLSQVFGNLLRNAVDAMYQHPRQRLTLVSRRRDRRLLVEVADTGCGIPAEHRDHLFDPFFTTKSANATQGEPVGTGLGLFTVGRLLEGMGGAIEVASEVGAGTTFSVWLPLDDQPT